MDVRILGPLEVYDGDGPVAIGGAKPRGLLAALVLNANKVVSTDRLIDTLWGERPPETAAKALQVHVSQLRKALGADSIRTRSPGYVLELGQGDLDVHRFEGLHERARDVLDNDASEARRLLIEALALWRGAPLADVAYEPFAQGEIARLEELRLAAIEDRIEADLALGNDVVGELDALVAEHPLRERLRGQHMLALYRAGRQAEALEAYHDARRALTEELGIEPGRELQRLQRAILEQATELDERPAAPVADAGFVGRDAELGELTAALGDALAGRGRLVLVGGEAGIGKSRLAEELARRAQSRGARVLVGRCWEAGGAPAYWPWVQVLRACVRGADPAVLRTRLGHGAADVAALVPELREVLPDLPDAPAPESEGARFRLLEAAANFLSAAAAAEPLVLVVDDLHVADAPSLVFLRFLTGRLGDAPILVVGCYRDTEVRPDLADALSELGREPVTRRLGLSGLSGVDTARLLESALGDAPTEDLAEHVQAETQGNPLFATEIGRLVAAEGQPAGGGLPIPEGVRDVIRRRLERESKRCREVLALASVMGRDFDADVIGQVGELGEDELLGALDEAAAARLVTGAPGAGGRLRFSHILVRDALYEDLLPPRRARLHGAIAAGLEAFHAANLEPYVAELAHHYLAAGRAGAAKAIEFARRAGDRAARQYAYEEAARHYADALDVMEATGSADADARCELLLSHGAALSRGGSARAAKKSLDRAAALAEEIGRPDQLARAAVEYGGRFAWARASTDPALVPLIERALRAVGEEDSAERARLLTRLAAALRDEPARARRVRLVEEALAIAERLGDEATLASALVGHWIARETPESAREGVALGARLIEIGERTGDKDLVFAGHDFRVHSYWWQADRTAVALELEGVERLADELRQPAHRWFVGTGQTLMALMDGRFEDAEELLAATRAIGDQAESWNARVSERIGLFVLRREQGRLSEVEDIMRRSVHEYPTLLRFRCARAHLDAELGRAEETRAQLDELLAPGLEDRYYDAEWMLSMLVLCDPAAAFADAEGTARLHDALLPFERLYSQAPVEAVFGCVARGLGVLATALGRLDQAEGHFDVALEVEDRMRARPWYAHVQHDLAAMLLARGGAGDADRASGLIAEAVTTYRELGMERWAARAEALAG